MTRWDTAERKVREHDVKLPADFLGFLMVNALQLDSEKITRSGRQFFIVFTCKNVIIQDVQLFTLAIGLNTLNLLQRSQPSELPITFCKELHQFRNVHQVSCTARLACIPSSLGPRGCILRPALFEEHSSADTPLLLSLPFLLHCKATLCLDKQRGLPLVSQHLGFSVPCHLGPTGALRIPSQKFTSDMISFLSQRIPKTSDE